MSTAYHNKVSWEIQHVAYWFFKIREIIKKNNPSNKRVSGKHTLNPNINVPKFFFRVLHELSQYMVTTRKFGSSDNYAN